MEIQELHAYAKVDIVEKGKGIVILAYQVYRYDEDSQKAKGCFVVYYVNENGKIDSATSFHFQDIEACAFEGCVDVTGYEDEGAIAKALAAYVAKESATETTK